MSRLIVLILTFVTFSLHAASPQEILRRNSRAIVYLQVEDNNGQVLNRGSGFIVSQDGYIVTVAHLKVEPTQRMRAVIGQRDGTFYTLQFRAADDSSDIALWQLPQSTVCRHSITISTSHPKVMDRLLVIGFPGNDGLTPAAVNINNLTSALGFYKADGELRPGNSGAPAFNESGNVVAIVEGGAIAGAQNNDLIPIAPAVALLKKRGVQANIDQTVPFDEACYASCRHVSHGIERWEREAPWGPKNTGWLGGGNNRTDQCNSIIAAEKASDPAVEIELLPGEGIENLTGMWEKSKIDVFGRVEYKYFCKGTIRSNPVYVEKQSSACGLWN